jgi:hypothetical protein
MNVVQAVKNILLTQIDLVLEAKRLAHLGKRAAIDQALSRLERAGVLKRLARGQYVSAELQVKPTRIATLEEALRAFGVTVTPAASRFTLHENHLRDNQEHWYRLDNRLAKSPILTLLYAILRTEGKKIQKSLLEQFRKNLSATDLYDLQHNLRSFRDWMIEKFRHWLPKLVV